MRQSSKLKSLIKRNEILLVLVRLQWMKHTLGAETFVNFAQIRESLRREKFYID